jgi:hypothetical protein
MLRPLMHAKLQKKHIWKYEYSTYVQGPTFFFMERQRKRMKQAVKLMSQILFYSEVQTLFIRLKNNVHESAT